MSGIPAGQRALGVFDDAGCSLCCVVTRQQTTGYESLE